MGVAGPAQLTVLADDLTGACDTGTVFAGPAPVPVVVWPRPAPPAAVRAIDTESRTLAPAEAGRRLRGAADLAPGRRHFKKIDSTLRGPVGAELDALLDAGAGTGALVCPAFPAQGRIVRDRVLLVDGVPVADTALGRDPRFPRAVDGPSSSVVDLLRPQLGRPLAWLPLEVVRREPSALTARLERLAGAVVVADAETDADLDRLVAAALAVEPGPLLAGAAGLARALAGRLGLDGPPAPLPRGHRWLLVAGSRHPASRRQIEEARAAGIRVLSTPAAEAGEAAAITLAGEARSVLETEAFDLVAVTGGETALALWTALGAERIDLLGAPRPGLALGTLRVPGGRDLPLLTKAGGFGEPGLFAALRREATT